MLWCVDMVLYFRKPAALSGLGLSSDGLDWGKRRKLCCGQVNQNIKLFLEIMDVTFFGLKRKKTAQLVMSTQPAFSSKASIASMVWAWIACTSGKAPLMLNNVLLQFWRNMLRFTWCLSQGRSCLFQQDNAKQHSPHSTAVFLSQVKMRQILLSKLQQLVSSVTNNSVVPTFFKWVAGIK